MKNEMVETKGFWYKVKSFFRNLFGKKEVVETEEVANEEVNVEPEEETFEKSKSDFIESMAVQKDEDRERLFNLQIQLRQGYITKDDLSEEDIQKLSDLCDEQIASLEEEIARNNELIEKYRKQLAEG